MKNFLKGHGLWVLFAAAVIAVALAVMSFLSTTSSPLANVAGVLSSPFRSAYTAVATWFNDKQNYYKDTTALEEENAELRQQIAKMEAQIRQAQDDSEENAFLRDLLGLTLDKGTNYDIAVNDCVVDATGNLVGIVSEVGYNWCTVLTVVDTSTSMGAQVFRTKDLGVAVGDFSLMGDGRLRMDYLPADCQLLGGDLVVTSGLGGYYPSGLVIGSVEEVQKDDSGASSYAVLVPEADLDSLTEVAVIKSFDIVS